MTISEPPDILIIIDFKDIKNIKQLGMIKLKKYNLGIVTERKIFLFFCTEFISSSISAYDNFLKNEYDDWYGVRNSSCSFKLKKHYFFRYEICYLNNNRFCLYRSSDNKIDIYKINY